MKKKSRKKPLINRDLTNTEKVILGMLSNEYLTPKKIAIRRRCSKQAVYQHILSLKRKGYLKKGFNILEKNESTIKVNQKIRLHAQEFNIKIIYLDERYKSLLNKCNVINLEGNTIRLYRNSIEVYSGQSFYADDVNKATAKSIRYFNKLFVRLEDELKIILIKPRKQNIKQVNAHYAEINNELAEECEKKCDKIRIYTTEDGKLWFVIDNSFNMHEAETLHPNTNKEDMKNVQNHFNDIRNNSPPTLSELMGIMKEIVQINKETSSGLNAITHFISNQLPQEMKGLNKKLDDYIR